MNIDAQQKWRSVAIFIFIALPIVSLFLNAISWLKFGIDIPYWDDWGLLIKNNTENFDWRHLFAPGNDTLYPVGTGLDLLFYRYLSGNVLAYQFISMIVVLGLLLFLQWRLLLLALKDKLLAASAFSLTLFMLQPNTYWGIQYIAYHQALPLVFSLAAIYMVLGKNWTKWSPLALVALGFLSGFSYISGAFSILTLSIIFIIGSQFIRFDERKPLLQGGLALLGTSIITVSAQMWVLVFVQKGNHLPNVPMAYPFESNFWLYYFGKIARALMLPIGSPMLSLILTSIVVIFIISLLMWSVKSILKNKAALSETKTTLIYIAISGMVFVYVCLVAAGRANEGIGAYTQLEIFSGGFHRFHFFWITLLWPWIIAMILTISTKKTFLSIFIPIVTIPYLFIVGAFNHAEYYQNAMQQRVVDLKCLIEAAKKGQEIHCPQLFPGDLSGAVLTAKLQGVSFSRMINLPLSSHSSQVELKELTFQNITTSRATPDGYDLITGHDPMIFLETKTPEIMAQCKILNVSVLLRATEPSAAQVFYLTPGQAHFSEEASLMQPVQGDNIFHKIDFQLISKDGFINTLRLDPVFQAQKIEIKDLEINCINF